MKVLYVSGPSFLDMDLSFVGALNRECECHYLMDLYPKLHKATALDLTNAPNQSDVIPMAEIPEMKVFSRMLPLDRAMVINRTSDNPLALSNILLQWNLFWMIRKLNPDVIHFNNQIHFTHFYLFFFRKKIIISIHDPFPHSGEEQETKTISAKIYRWLNVTLIRDHLLYNNLMNSEYAADRGIVPSRVVNSSLGPYEYMPLMQEQDTEKQCDFLFFGRIQRYKGLDLLLESFVILLKDYPNATLTIAGSGSLWFDIHKYNIPNHNLLLLNRFIPSDELATLINGASVVVCPYRDATQSGVVMSAYAFHKPVIVTNVGALADVVEEGLTGFVIEPDDANALATAMTRVLKGELSPEISKNAIHDIYHVGEKSWRAIVKRIMKVYQKVAS